jgi:hypothetical protein
MENFNWFSRLLAVLTIYIIADCLSSTRVRSLTRLDTSRTSSSIDIGARAEGSGVCVKSLVQLAPETARKFLFVLAKALLGFDTVRSTDANCRVTTFSWQISKLSSPLLVGTHLSIPTRPRRTSEIPCSCPWCVGQRCST